VEVGAQQVVEEVGAGAVVTAGQGPVEGGGQPLGVLGPGEGGQLVGVGEGVAA
jgi:hypothetical protein